MSTLGYPIRVVIDKIEKLPNKRGRLFTNEGIYVTTCELSDTDLKRNGTATLYIFDEKVTKLRWS